MDSKPKGRVPQRFRPDILRAIDKSDPNQVAIAIALLRDRQKRKREADGKRGGR